MPAPTYSAAGTVQQSAAGVTVPWPGSHAVDDIGLLIVETANQAVSFTNAQGFVAVTSSPQGTGTAGGTAATRLSVYWCRATSGAMASPVIADAGDHIQAQILTFKGCARSGNPWDQIAGDVLASASTSVTIPGVTTTLANTLCVAIVANATDTTTQQTGNMTNANLTGISERTDLNTTSGNGGGFGVATGVKAAAGATGNTTCTLGTSSVQGRMLIALKPEPDTVVQASSTLAATALRAVVLGVSLVSFAAPARANARLIGQSTAPLSSSSVNCSSTVRLGSGRLVSDNQTLLFATTPIRATSARLLGNATVVGTVASASDLRTGSGRLIGQTVTNLYCSGRIIGQSRLVGQTILTSVASSTLRTTAGRLIGNSNANLSFTPVNCASDLRIGAGRFIASGSILSVPSTLRGTQARLIGVPGIVTRNASTLMCSQAILSGIPAVTGNVNPIAIDHRVVAIRKTQHGTCRIPPIQGHSIMDTRTADTTTLTADDTIHTTDTSPMGRNV